MAVFAAVPKGKVMVQNVVRPVVDVSVRVEHEVVAAVAWYEADAGFLVGECFLMAGTDATAVQAALREAADIIRHSSRVIEEGKDPIQHRPNETDPPF